MKHKDQVTVYMVQTMPRLWRIQSEKGIVLMDDIMVYSVREATDYVRRYVSSWDNWNYEVKPLEESK